VLERTGADPGGLTLEFKEKTVLADLNESVARMTALKQLGVRLAIDDFGIGCSSLSQLTQLPLDQLKIDSSVVRQIGAKPQDKAIVQALIDVTRNLEMETLAEGVETEAQQAFLEQHGCHAFQGYLFGKAVPAAEFERLLTLH
jgi:EAL domain-containing protein (putative c-di-GMP-specific phosphodiesterase class I)